MHSTNPLIKLESLKHRIYQEEIASKALEKNTLVVLPTGVGKTIIAAIVAAERLVEHPSSKILFLAPTKPLAVQHQKTFRELLNVEETAVLTGEIPTEKRAGLWAQRKIIFATPQAIENDILRGLRLEDVSLIIFDEAHRASGNYSYVHIAGEYAKNKDHLILALTASPSSNKEKIDEILKNLHISQIEIKGEDDPDVKPYLQNIKTSWVKVDLPPEFLKVKNMIEDVLKDSLTELKESGYIKTMNIKKINKKTLLEVQAKIRGEITSGGDSYTHASTAALAIKINHALELLETQGASAVEKYFKRLGRQKTKAVKKIMSDKRVHEIIGVVHSLSTLGLDHPKLDRLLDIVEGYRGDRILVFTQYRDTVDKIIERLGERGIPSHEFIGQAVRDGEEGMTQKQQIKILEGFARGDYNVLVATSVAEEGLDVPKVDKVIFYEPIPSEIRSIQRRGRTGRSHAGEVFILMAKNTRDEGYFWSSFHREKKMKETLKTIKSEIGKNHRQKTLTEYTPAEDNHGIRIYADIREKNTDIIRILKENTHVEVHQLPVGDYILSDRVCVERKTIDDFLQSIVDSRLITQAKELSQNFEAPILMLEGDLMRTYAQRDIHPNAIRGMLASLAVDFRISIIPTQNSEDTARTLYVIAKREQEDERRVAVLRGERKPFTLAEKQQFIVESLPNVSAVLARRLLRHFGSVQKIMNASEKELMEVDGIGKKKAEGIIKVVKKSYIL